MTTHALILIDRASAEVQTTIPSTLTKPSVQRTDRSATSLLGIVTIVSLVAIVLCACDSSCPAGSMQVGTVCRVNANQKDGGGADESNESGKTGSGTKTSPVTSAGTGSSLIGTAGVGIGSGGGSTGTAANGSAAIGAGQMGASGMVASAAGTMSEPERCSEDGAMRCSMRGEARLELCRTGIWVAGPACGSGETCTAVSGTPSCKPVAELCRGSNGQAVCDTQGTMFLCNPDDTVASKQVCKSTRFCQDGIASRTCALCAAGEEFQCSGVSLEACADGKSFMKVMDCTSAALCNKNLGMCTAAVCMPNTFVCQDNVLKQCKADSSGYDDAAAVPCGMGTCDAKGGDCNMCEPGQKSCMGDSVATCDPTGQMLVPTPCGGSMKCAGAGKCVECTGDSDCVELTMDCKVGACMQNRCVAKDATTGKACTAGNGKPGKCASGGTCECTPNCNKPCGDNGCGKPCPNTCGALMCVKDACVECTADSQCRGTDCKVGVCGDNGRCSQSATPREGASCKSGGVSGTCTQGECVCKSDCGRQHCQTDSCGRSCSFPCGNGMECRDNECQAKPTPTPTSCASGGGCGADGVHLCDATLNYCTEYCGTCQSGWQCVGGVCAILPPCAGGMSVVSYSGVSVCAYPHAP